jgi:hypothetical protein
MMFLLIAMKIRQHRIFILKLPSCEDRKCLVLLGDTRIETVLKLCTLMAMLMLLHGQKCWTITKDQQRRI